MSGEWLKLLTDRGTLLDLDESFAKNGLRWGGGGG